MVLDLTQNERRVLLALSKLVSASPEELAGETGLGVDSAMQSAFLLEEKGLLEISEELKRIYSLTSEGEEYAEKGLPERQILTWIKEPTPISEIEKRFPPKLVAIALGWIRRKGWARIEEGKILPSGELGITQEEEILARLKSGPAPGNDLKNSVLGELIRRNLLEVKELKIRTIRISKRGQEIASLGVVLEEEITQLAPNLIRSRAWKEKKLRPYNIYLTPPKVYGAKIHPYQRLLDKMRRIFLEMGFTEIKGEIVQSSFWNFDALFQPQDHPARDMQDTFYLETESELPDFYLEVKKMHEHGGDIGSTGWGGRWSEALAKKQVLRTHTTAITIKYLADNPLPPVKAFCIDRAYRREAIDSTHTPEFEQLEGVVMDKGVSFRNLLGFLEEFYHRMGFEEVRFRPGYFPYTEPSVEPEVYIEGLGWMELGGAGIFRKEVTAPLGIEYPVLAWGLGVSRVAMLKLGLQDLRELYQSDIDWLRRSPACQS